MLNEDEKASKRLSSHFLSDGITKLGSGTLIPPGMAPLPTRLTGFHQPTTFSSGLIFYLFYESNLLVC